MIVIGSFFVVFFAVSAISSIARRNWVDSIMWLYFAMILAGGIGLSSGNQFISENSIYVQLTGISIVIIYFGARELVQLFLINKKPQIVALPHQV